MTALETPAADAPAKEWGSLAVRIPGWRWPISTDSAPEPDMPGLFRIGRLSWRSTRGAQSKHQWTQHYGKGKCVPDPDHWAWWGWFITLLGPTPADGYMAHILPPGGAVTDWRIYMNTAITGPMSAYGTTLGRACIAAAAANGRWPGGAS